MSVSHLSELRRQLERRHWRILAENNTLSRDADLHWAIARPDGSSPLTLRFLPGFYGKYGDIQHESIDESIACEVVGHSELPDLYFGKFHGQYQKDVAAF